MALSTTANYSLRKHDAGDLNWDVDVNWNMTEIDKKLKLLFANFLTCSTEIGTVAKTAAFSNFVLETGCLVAVKFVNGNSASGATLNVNSTGAKAIQYNGAAIPTNAIVANGVYLLVYDGTNWAVLNPVTVSDAITEDETGLAPSQGAVFDALALKLDSSDVAVTAAANKIPKADANGDIDSGWIKDATTAVKGVVKVGNSLSSASGVLSVVPASTTVKGAVELATPAEVLAGTDDERAVTSKGLDYSYATLDSNRIYDGVDLATKFAAEIAGYSDVWAWLKARIAAVDFSGLHVGDYVPFVMNGNAIKAQIAGIDTYYRTSDVEIGHHIDFISKDCYPTPVPWNTTNVNNGDATNAAPWMISNIKSVLNTTWYGYLPAALQAQIIEKRAFIETRYASDSTLTNSTGSLWSNIGKLWVPNEGEVYGAVHWGTKGFSSIQNAQYPIFAASLRNRIKGAGNGGNRCAWWLLSVRGDDSAKACAVGNYGHATSDIASRDTFCAPVCFRIR